MLNRRTVLVPRGRFPGGDGSVLMLSSTAGADTEKIEFSQDGTFWRLQPRDPIVDVPCQAPIPPERCGQVAPTAGVLSAPNVTDGNMVVGHAGGPPGADKGDQFWIVSEPDLASLGPIGSVENLTLVYTRAADARGDFGTPVIKACNIVVAFGVGEGTNPWDDKPAIDCGSAKVPRFEGTKVIFDVTDLAQTWIDGKGYGIAIVPGLPGASAVVNDPARLAELAPFQLTLVNANKADANRVPVLERATGTIVFTPEEDSLGGDEDGGLGDDLLIDDFGTDETGLGDVGAFDTGGEDLAAGGLDDGGAVATGSDGQGNGTTRLVAASRPGFAWILLLLLPLFALAIWGAGSALGPLGDPVPVRQGGVGRLVARRRAGRADS